MNLIYSILWVEDAEDWVESIEESIREFIEEECGFEFSKKLISGNQSGIDYKEYDLILMDFNLNNTTGDKIIDAIRKLDVLTDVVFYSEKSSDTLKNKVAENNLEGVYYASREKNQFLEKVKHVILSTIKKVQDLQNLRGLVMAEVSELDAQMDSIIRIFYNDSNNLDIFHSHITKNRERSIHETLEPNITEPCKKNCELKWRNLPLADIMCQMDSSQRAYAIHEMLKILDPKNETFNLLNFNQTYYEKIISVRNNLAHCESVKDGEKEILKTSKGDQTFSSDDFKKIRKNIITYRNAFSRLLKHLNDLKDKNNVA